MNDWRSCAPGARRCGYCEDSDGDEIEHIKPRDLYPEKTFAWENYLLACGQCNRSKSSRFLNREVLRVARSEAYGSYRARLHEYRDLGIGGASNADLRTLRDAIMTTAHPTVWREMQRQHVVIDELRELFQSVPEALNW